MKQVLAMFTGAFLVIAGGTGVGIGIWLWGGGHRMSEPSRESLGAALVFIALAVLIIAALLFRWVIRREKENRKEPVTVTEYKGSKTLS